MMRGVGEEGMRSEMAPDGLERPWAWAVARLRRALGWRAEPTTAGLILAGVLAYFAYLNLQSADQLIRRVFGIVPSGDVYYTLSKLYPFYSASARALDLTALGLGIGEAIAALGCLVMAAHRGRAVALTGVVIALISRLGNLIVVLGERAPGQYEAKSVVDVVGLLLIGWVVSVSGPATSRPPARPTGHVPG